MDDGATTALSRSFGAAAAAYAEHRPGYAHDAVAWATAGSPGRRVLDLGAGTGKLTESLVRTGVDVVAVEPDPSMLAQLRAGLPAVRSLLGSAESIPLPDGSVDAVVVGHALHWFDMRLAGPEMARVTVAGGTVAGLWNVVDDRVGWVDGLVRVAGPAALGPRDLLSSWRAATSSLLAPARPIEQEEFPHPQPHTVDSLVAKIATHAGVLVLPADERRSLLDRIRRYLDRRPETADGTFVLPMLTGVLRARLHPGSVLEH